MRRVALLLGIALAAAGCAGTDPATPVGASPTPTVPGGASASELAGGSCEDRTGGDASVSPDFTEVRFGQEGSSEWVEFRFEGGGDAPPLWSVRFVDELVTDGEGAPVRAAGAAFVEVSFMARGVDLSGEEFVEIYTGPTELMPSMSTVLEVEQLGDFEGLVSWGIGLSRHTCFIVDARPDGLRLDFPLTL